MLLNLTPDHLDRHASFEEYARAKMRMFENQLDRDAAVLNADDPEVTRRMPTAAAHLLVQPAEARRAGRISARRTDRLPRGRRRFRSRGATKFRLRGEHNVENVLAACAAAYLAGAEPAAIASGVKTFRGVEHRLEFVAEIGGVAFFNDSKATNVDASLKALEAFPGPLLVILGGKDKGAPYTALREPLRQRARLAFLIGAAAEKIAAELSGAVPLRACRDARPRRGDRRGRGAAGRHRAARAGLLQLRPV